MNLATMVDTTLTSFRQDVPDYVGSALIDMSTGMLLDSDTIDDRPRELLDVLAAAATERFQGRTATQVEGLWHERRAEDDPEHLFREIIINSDDFVHVFLRSRTAPDFVAAVVCRSAVNLGMLLAQARQVMRTLDELS